MLVTLKEINLSISYFMLVSLDVHKTNPISDTLNIATAMPKPYNLYCQFFLLR
jgi:hypothetical protein